MLISASIVVYNEDKKVLGKAIESFFSISYEKELIILDNSPRKRLEKFCNNYINRGYNLKYIFVGRNLGFGAGHNLAFNKLVKRSNIHIILNPDIFFKSSEMEKFLEWFYERQDVVLSTLKVLNIDGTIQETVRNIPTPLTLLKRRFGFSGDVIHLKHNGVYEIPFAHGNFMAFKTKIFDELGGFDEKFFIYMEDVDIWIRAKQFGKTVINMDYSIHHYWRKESSKNLKLFIYHTISVFRFFKKHKKAFRLSISTLS